MEDSPTEPAGLLAVDVPVSVDESVLYGASPLADPPRSTRALLAFGDALSAVLIVLATTVGTRGLDGLTTADPVLVGLAGAAALSTTLWWRNTYVVSRSIRWDGNLSTLISSVAGVSAAMIGASWVFVLEPARLWQLIISVSWLASMGLLRFVLSRRRDSVSTPVKVIVAGNTGDALATRLALRADQRTSYDVQGFVMDRLDEKVPVIVSQLALGSIDHLAHVAKKADTDLVVVCLGAIDAERFAPLVRQLNFLGVEVALSTGLSNVAFRRVSLGHVSGRPLVRVTPAPLGGWHLATKRALDIVGATLLLVLSSPLMLAATIAIRIEDGGRALFRQRRVGKAGQPFTIYKFRTMVNEAEELQIDLTNDLEGPVFKMREDPRITRVGRVLRKTSMDELPQIINILRGDMSLVGPRPLPIHEVEAAPTSFPDRHAVKPGLTGRGQVSGRSNTGFAELDELDRWYVDNWSLGQDLEILARTVPAVLLARGAR
jgi:exopolysaccharide biosynthesis polyprenyl glycosylphosphotransferase